MVTICFVVGSVLLGIGYTHLAMASSMESFNLNRFLEFAQISELQREYQDSDDLVKNESAYRIQVWLDTIMSSWGEDTEKMKQLQQQGDYMILVGWFTISVGIFFTSVLVVKIAFKK